jgi:hypothetical protein
LFLVLLSVHRVLTAQDYTLILGMPGSGKTSTIVQAVKELMARGSSVLIMSYTNRCDMAKLLCALPVQEKKAFPGILPSPPGRAGMREFCADLICSLVWVQMMVSGCSHV